MNECNAISIESTHDQRVTGAVRRGKAEVEWRKSRALKDPSRDRLSPGELFANSDLK